MELQKNATEKKNIETMNIWILSSKLKLNCRSLKKQKNHFPSKSDCEQLRLIANDILCSLKFSSTRYRETFTSLKRQ